MNTGVRALLLLVVGCGFNAGNAGAGDLGESSAGSAGDDASGPSTSVSTSAATTTTTAGTTTQGMTTVGESETDTGSPLGPFGPPRRIEELSTPAGEDDPTLTADQLQIFFDSSRPGGFGNDDIWFSRRMTVSDPWDPPQPVTTLNSAQDDQAPELSHDGLQLFFASDRVVDAFNGYDLFVSTRATPNSNFGPPVRIDDLAGPEDLFTPALTPDQLALYLCTPGFGGMGRVDIAVSRRDSVSEPWFSPQLEPIVNSDQRDCSPWVDGSSLFLFMHSDRAGTLGGADIMVSVREGVAADWSTPVAVQGINTADGEDDPWLTPNLDVIYFASDRDGSRDIWTATRQ